MLYNVGINLEEYGSLAGGAISEKLGGSYELGATIGNIVGGVAGSVTYSKIVSMKNISATKVPNNECHPNCFIAGTLVATSDGYKAIEGIQAGDMVLAENPETGEIALKRVVQTFENESDELVHVFVNGEEIITTPNHPFYVPKLGWTSAIKLRAGDVLVLSNGEYVVVEFVQHEILEEPVKVYNFEVEDFHTYFVGESSVLVHNKCRTKWGAPHTKANPKHNNAIEDMLDWAEQNNAVKTSIRKNKWQVDVNGKYVLDQFGRHRRPDASFVIDNVRYNTNFVSNPNSNDEIAREIEAFLAISDADPNSVVSLFFDY